MTSPQSKPKAGYKEVFSFAFHYWRRRPVAGISLLIFMAAATMTDILVPIYTGRIIDALIGVPPGDAKAMDQAVGLFGVFVLLGLSFVTLRAVASALWNWFAVHNLHEILTEATARVQRFSADWHANSFAGATVRKITRGMWAFDTFGDTIFIGLLPAFLIMTGMTAMLIVKLPDVGMFVAVMVVIYCVLSVHISFKYLSPRYKASAAADTAVGAALADMMTGIPTIKSFGSESREDTFFNDVAGIWRHKSYHAWQATEFANFIRHMLRIIMMMGMVGITVWMWRRGAASAGDISLSLTSFFLISGYMRDIGMHVSQLQRSSSEMEDIVLFRLYQDEVPDARDAVPFRPGPGEIVFDHVRFGYKGKDPIYDDFNLTIRPGERVALVGPSGAGKSTFVKLVQRLYDIQGGRIMIDGQDISRVTQTSLRHSIALVPQDPILFHRSLAENIAYGKPGASLEEITEAAKKAFAHEFIASLPHGYDTLVGERGVKLSGGERQRVAIARAILANAPILILDEATSSLDSISEDYIQKGLQELMKGRTTVTIAHRLSTIRAVDRILVFSEGKIVEQGTHDELLTRAESHYRRLYEMQALGFVE